MQKVESGLRTSRILAWMAFILICGLVAALGVSFYKRQHRAVEAAARDNLQMAQELYSTQISYWRAQHITLARMLASSPRFRLSMARLWAARTAKTPLDVESAQNSVVETLQVLNKNYEYRAALITDLQGKPLVEVDTSGSVHHISTFADDIDPEDLSLCLELNEPVFSSIYLPKKK